MDDKKNLFEQKITSTSISIVKSPKREETLKMKNEVTTDFCKKYANIQIGENAQFDDRMQFDIYKRATKDKRMMLIEDLGKDKIPKEYQEKLYERLIDDGKKWSKKKKTLENFISCESSRAHSGMKKMTKQESDRLYARMMQQKKEKEEDLIKKRTELKLKKMQEELSEMQSARPARTLKKEEIDQMLTRFENDATQRKKSREYLAKMKEQLLDEEVSTYFKPKINTNNIYSPTTFDSRLLSEKKEKFKHIQSPVNPTTVLNFNEDQYLNTITSLSSKFESPEKQLTKNTVISPKKKSVEISKPKKTLLNSKKSTTTEVNTSIRTAAKKISASGATSRSNLNTKNINLTKKQNSKAKNAFVPNYKAEKMIEALYNGQVLKQQNAEMYECDNNN